MKKFWSLCAEHRAVFGLCVTMLFLFSAFPSHALPSTRILMKAKEFSTVYYFAEDGKRYVFPNYGTFVSWYPEGSRTDITLLSPTELALMPFGGNVTYRPGVRLVKIPTHPKVYAVAAHGVLRWIQTENVAKALYGIDWNKKVDDIPDAFFVNYTVGADIGNSSDFSPSLETLLARDIHTDKTIGVPSPSPSPSPTQPSPTQPSPAPNPTPTAGVSSVSSTSGSGGGGTLQSTYFTSYGYNDNDDGFGHYGTAAIAYPDSRHPIATEGLGTYTDPITFATDPREIPPHTMIYVPYLQKYFVMDDGCVECTRDWNNGKKWRTDLFMGGNKARQPEPALANCEASITRNDIMYLNAGSGYPVDMTPLFSGGVCTARLHSSLSSPLPPSSPPSPPPTPPTSPSTSGASGTSGGTTISATSTGAFGFDLSSSNPLSCTDAKTLEELVSCIVSHFDPFVPPTVAERSDFRTIARSLFTGNCETTSLPSTLGSIFSIRSFTDRDTSKIYCVLMEVKDADGDTKADRGWGAIIVNNAPKRELNIAIAHPMDDWKTEEQGIGVFKGTDSRTFFLAGARRYVGTPSTCQPDNAHSSSDAAHTDATLFFAATQELNDWYGRRSWNQIQFHGMGSGACPGVDVYSTNGKNTTPVSGDILLTLKTNLLKYHSAWSVTVPGDSPSCSLSATTNVQGRYLNGVSAESVCTVPATSYSQKFISIEQVPGFRQAIDWVAAIKDTWPIL
ncbi:MAG: hypothetical protein AAB879_01630 [Patescibacteria group bacterium]